MNILVLEDESVKGQDILALLQENHYSTQHVFCTDSIKKEIKIKKYDALILDLKVPKRNTEKGNILNGVELIQYIFGNVTDNFYRPKAVFVVTSFYDEEEIKSLKVYPISIIPYNPTTENNWGKILLQQLNYFIPFKCHVAIITAVDIEFKAISSWGWELKENLEDMPYFTKTIKNENDQEIHMILVQQECMGMVAATMLTSKVINYFKPKCVIMLGMCAGRKDAANLGDMIFAVDAWDYGSGSIGTGKKKMNFEPAPNYIQINQDLKNIFSKYKKKKTLLDNLKKNIFDFAMENEDGDLIKLAKSQLSECNKIHTGAMATGAAVIRNEEFTKMFVGSQNRKYIGLDMETYGVYYAAQNSPSHPYFFCVKCVTDVADENKGDAFQEYCSLLASEAVKYYIANDFTIE